MRKLRFTIRRADSYGRRKRGEETASYVLRFERVPVFDLRLVPDEDDEDYMEWLQSNDPLDGPRNNMSWLWANILDADELAAYRPPNPQYQGVRIHLHPTTELVVVFHSLEIEFVGAAGSPWYQNPDGAR